MRRLGTTLLVTAVMATGLAVAASPARADHIESINRDVTRDDDDLRRYGTWHKGSGGGSGWSGWRNSFWYTTRTTSYAYWYFGELRGVYRAEIFYPTRAARPRPTASPKFEIQQQDARTERWHTVRTVRDRIRENGNYKTKWKGVNNVVLDGKIRVKISKRYGDNRYILAADQFRFKWRDLIEEDKKIAIQLCQANALNEVVQQKEVIGWVKLIKDVNTIVTSAAVSYLLGVAAIKAVPAAIAGVGTTITAMTRLKSATPVLKAVADATRFIQQTPRLIDLTSKGLELTSTGLKVVVEMINFADDVAADGVLGEHTYLYDKYKRLCEYRDGTAVDWDTGQVDYLFGKGYGGGCRTLLKWSCVSGYLDHAAKWHP